MKPNPEMWSPARLAMLKQLWRDGVTAREISQHLGVTRNTVIGKLHRLGLLGSERANLTPAQIRSRDANDHRPRKLRPIQLPALPKPVGEVSKYLTMEELTLRSCRWIEGDPQQVSVVLYCGEKVVMGTAWCPNHYRRVYRLRSQGGSMNGISERSAGAQASPFVSPFRLETADEAIA